MRYAKQSLVIACLILAGFSAGCRDSKIPLFNPDARPMNRLASGNELIAELNGQIATARALGWISQDTIDKGFSPTLDKAAELADTIETLISEGSDGAAKAKLDALAAMLRSVRDQLKQLEMVNR